LLFDGYNRRIDSLRVSVTDRCNQRCVYCAPGRRFVRVDRKDILSFEEIRDVVRAAAKLGIERVRLTGGEPLVRRDVEVLVGMLAGIAGIKDLAMTTNGVRLRAMAGRLKAAGLHRLNVSLDRLEPRRYAALTGCADLPRVLAGLQAARKAGFERIKLNCVVERHAAEPDARAVAAFARANGFDVQFIRRMNLATGEFWPVKGGRGGRCAQCSRLRLSCTGLVQPCLFSDLAFSVRELGPRCALLQAARAKPRNGQQRQAGAFHSIGG
jgi:cyclic pyranopterin phosphate synthase